MDDSPTGTFIIRSVNLPSSDAQEAETAQQDSYSAPNAFRVNAVHQGQPRPQTPRIRMRSPFAVEGQTIPTKCPRCHTENQITQKHAKHWQCKVCDFEWR